MKKFNILIFFYNFFAGYEKIMNYELTTFQT